MVSMQRTLCGVGVLDPLFSLFPCTDYVCISQDWLLGDIAKNVTNEKWQVAALMMDQRERTGYETVGL